VIARQLGLRLVLALAVGALLVLGLTASRASARTKLPRAPTELNTGAKDLAVRPQDIYYTGDGTGLLTGSTLRSGIRWSSWTAGTALGTGENQINNCKPSCAGGTFTAYPVRLEMWKPATLHGVLVFTRLTLWYTGRRPAGEPAHYTFTDLYSGGWGFSPPDASGYCTHTDGQPRSAGCANINALP
jgi:hypothetical protein